jgi:large subunit ribosomal protein L29
MKAGEVRNMDDDELERRLAEAKHELFNLRFQHVTGQQENYSRLGQVRKDVARMKTVLREREITAAEAADEMQRQAPAASSVGSEG